MRVRDFAAQTGLVEELEFDDVLIGCLRVDEMIGLLGGNTGVFDAKHAEIRSDLEGFIEKCKGIEGAKKNFRKTTANLFMEGLKNNPNVYEGFEPESVLDETVERHFSGIIECIRRSDYRSPQGFSQVRRV